MKIVTLTADVGLEAPCVATIGCFDGVHRGHQRVIRQVMELAHSRGLMSAVITFDRQPRELFDPSFVPQLLTSLEEKEDCMDALGVDQMVVLPFTTEVAQLSAESFMRRVLRDQLNVRILVAGYDNRFGRNREEGFEDYVRYGQSMGIEVRQEDVELVQGEKAVSSTAIRQLLAEEGRVDLMPQWLTRAYTLSGRIVRGEHIGHELGFPTANLEPESAEKLIPANGVYAVRASLDGGEILMPAMMNIGVRPTFEGHSKTLEVHIMKDVGDIYGRRLTVAFESRLRAERRFESREALVRQLALDRLEAERVLRE